MMAVVRHRFPKRTFLWPVVSDQSSYLLTEAGV